MASHGVPRRATKEERSEAAQALELKKIEEYRAISDEMSAQMKAFAYTAKTLVLTSKLLAINPEHYTGWNYRRKILLHGLFPQKKDSKDAVVYQQEILTLLNNDLRFLFPLLRQYPKCYWIWNYRLWILGLSNEYVSADASHGLWEAELALVSKMLTLDNRNFHGWGYRRIVVAELEKQGPSMLQAEFDYTTRMIKVNLSNFSAWHQRLKLLPRLLQEQQASAKVRLQNLRAELELITQALYTDPDDQSLWFYHQGLVISNLSPQPLPDCIAPGISTEERTAILRGEVDMIRDLREDSEDSKWLYEALYTYEGLMSGVSSTDGESKTGLLDKLTQLDPMRSGRWTDLKSME